MIRQMTMMPISIGLPSSSLIFCLELLRVMAFRDSFFVFFTVVDAVLPPALPSAREAADALRAERASAPGLTAVTKGLVKKKPGPFRVP